MNSLEPECSRIPLSVSSRPSRGNTRIVIRKPRLFDVVDNPAIATFLLLILGAGMIALGSGLIEDAILYASVAIIFGVVLTIASFRSSREWIIRSPPSPSVLPALYIAVEVIAGSYLIFLGIVNQLVDLSAFDLGLTLIAVLGAALVVDSFLLYTRGFRQVSA